MHQHHRAFRPRRERRHLAVVLQRSDVVDYRRSRLKRDARARFAVESGVARTRIIVDPGLGFAKTAQHNLKLLAALPDLCALGYPVLVGASRKTFVSRIAVGTAAGANELDLEYGTAAANALAIAAGASIVRVHEVGAAVAAVRMAAAVTGRDQRFKRNA